MHKIRTGIAKVIADKEVTKQVSPNNAFVLTLLTAGQYSMFTTWRPTLRVTVINVKQNIKRLIECALNKFRPYNYSCTVSIIAITEKVYFSETYYVLRTKVNSRIFLTETLVCLLLYTQNRNCSHV